MSAGVALQAAVVVPTHDRALTLMRLLDALQREASSAAAPTFEVVVVDDASSDDTPQVLARFAAGGSLPLRVLRLDRNAGPAAARNAGWRATSAPVICFTDDDCVMRPGWVAAMVAALREADIAQGRTVPAPDQSHNKGPFSHTMDIAAEDGHYPTCNIGYRRSVLEATGGFDEEFRMPYGEDTDLAWRAIDGGASTVFVAEAVVEHDVRPSVFAAHLADLRRRGGLVHAISKHPHLRDNLPHRGYLRPGHLPAASLVVATGVAATRQADPVALLAMAAAGTWYAVATHRKRWGPPKRWQWVGALPLALVADLYEMAVLTRASVRYRRVVL